METKEIRLELDALLSQAASPRQQTKTPKTAKTQKAKKMAKKVIKEKQTEKDRKLEKSLSGEMEPPTESFGENE